MGSQLSVSTNKVFIYCNLTAFLHRFESGQVKQSLMFRGPFNYYVRSEGGRGEIGREVVRSERSHFKRFKRLTLQP